MVRNLKWQHFWVYLANHFLGTRNIVQNSMILFFSIMGIFYAEVSSGKFQTFTVAIQLSPELDLEGSTVPQPVRTNLNPNIRQDSTDWLNTSRSHGSFVKCPSLLSLSLQLMFFWLHRRTILRQTTTPVRR